MMHGAIFHAALTAALAVGGTSVHATARFADIVVLMDESGSMSGEQAWMRFAVPGLDAGLQARGLIGNAFGLVGFSAFSAPAPSRLRTFDVGNGLLGTSSDWVLASNGLVDRGDIEDGWAAIAATSSYPFRGSAARNLILVTDEDRDNTNAGLSFEGLLAAMKATNTLLNVVVNHTFRCGDRSLALGIVGTTGYKADGSGGFAKCEGAFRNPTGFAGEQYVDLALATGGGAWNLNYLRSGGVTADSFSAAFLDGKVSEIVSQPPAVPEPSTWGMFAGGLLLTWLGVRRRRASTAAR